MGSATRSPMRSFIAEFRSQRSEPDVSESDGVVVGREGKGQLVRDGLIVTRQYSMAGRAVDFLFVMGEEAVVQDGDISGLFELAVLEDGGEEDYIERLPLAGPVAGVYHRRGLAVNGACLAVRVNLLGV